MKTVLLCLALLAASSPVRPQEVHRYQLIAVVPNAKELGFVDAAASDRTSPQVPYWSLMVYEPPAMTSNNPPVIYQMRQKIADCPGRRARDRVVVAHYKNGNERWIYLISRFRPVKPGSIGESELDFVCSGKVSRADLPAFSSIDSALRFSDATAASQRGEHTGQSGT